MKGRKLFSLVLAALMAVCFVLPSITYAEAEAPTGLSLQVLTNHASKYNRVQLTWDAVEGAESYVVYRTGADDPRTYRDIKTTSYFDETAVNGYPDIYDYTYRVAAVVDGVETAACSGVSTTLREDAVNVALYKSVTANPTDYLNQYSPDKAVDDNTADTSRWVIKDNVTPPYWLEVDLGAAYTISAFQIEAGSNKEGGLQGFELQQKVNDTWETIPGTAYSTTSQYFTTVTIPVTPIKAQYIRLYIPVKTQIRLRELRAFALPDEDAAIETPSNVTISSKSDTALSLSWTASASVGIDGYKLYKDGTYIASVAADTLMYSFSGLTANTEYTLGVSAYRGDKESELVTVIGKTLAAAEQATLNLTAAKTTKDTITLSWDAIEGAAGYSVYRNDAKIADVSECTYSDTVADTLNLPCTTPVSYSYYVMANDDSKIYKSETISASTTANIAPNYVDLRASGDKYFDYKPENAFDGIFTDASRWISTPNNEAQERSLTLELDKTYLINEYMIYSGSTNLTRDFTKYVKVYFGTEACTGVQDTDPAHWVEKVPETAITNCIASVPMETPAAAKYVKFEFGRCSSSDQMVRIYEVQIFGTEDNGTTPPVEEWYFKEMNIADQNATITITKGNQPLSAQAKVIVACYDKYGNLEKAEILDVPNGASVTSAITVSTAEVKAFLWDMETLEPICNSMSKSI